jgi:hypothetical protein
MVYSQFIIITHNKRTISMADVLYGVTMQEHGVSKIVSVKFRKNEDGETQAPRTMEPPSVAESLSAPKPAPPQDEEGNGPKEDTIMMAK